MNRRLALKLILVFATFTASSPSYPWAEAIFSPQTWKRLPAKLDEAAEALKKLVTKRNAWSAIVRTEDKLLNDKQIEKLADIARDQGTVEIRAALQGLGLTEAAEIDAYARVAIKLEKLSREEGELLVRSLINVPGFKSTLAKIVGRNEVGTVGHLNELRIAAQAKQFDFKVEAIGERFEDGLKQIPTDIDVFLSRNGKYIAIEAKDYAPATLIPSKDFVKDMDSLVAFQKQHPERRTIAVFTLTHRPDDAQALRLLQDEASRRGIELVDGPPSAQAIQFDQLEKIL